MALASLATLTGCGDKLLGEAEVDAVITVTQDAGPGAADQGAATLDATVDSGEVSDGESPPEVEPDPVVPFEGGCQSDDECVGSCVFGVCVRPPPEARVATYSCDNEPVPGSKPDLGCWERPAPVAVGGPDRVPMRGRVEYFGQGIKTIGLRVRLYEFTEFDPSACASAGDREPSIPDARRLVETCLDDLLTPLADTEAVECDPPLAESACYRLDGVPTGRPLVARVTGTLSVWVPTYTYGLFINPCVAAHPRVETGTCPEQVSADVASFDWTCDLTEASGTVSFQRDLTVISQSTWTSFPPTAGIARINDGQSAVAGRILDCSGRSVMNATFGLARPGRIITYFNGDPNDTLPQPGLTYTNIRGTYADLSTPPGPNAMVAVARQDGAIKPVSFERFYVLPNTVVMVNPLGRRAVRPAPLY